MADVLTNRLRITKPDVGGSDDTWGSKLNTDMDIVDRVYRDLAGGLVTTSGTGITYQVALTHSDYADIDSTDGFRIALRSNVTNTGDVNLDVLDGNGARNMRKFVDGVQVQLAAGDFPIHYVGDFVYVRRSGWTGWIMLNPATGVVKPPPAASETVVGVTRFATNAEAQSEALATVAITPKNLASVGSTVLPDATTTVKGKVALATAGEFQAGSNATKAATPASITYATTGARGVVMLATNSDTVQGTDIKAVTPPGLKYAADNGYLVPTASMTVHGKVRIATLDEALNNNNITACINPYGLYTTLIHWRDNGLTSLYATTAAAGKVELATAAEVQTGTDNDRAVTPVCLVDANTTERGLIELATNAEALAATDGQKAITPSRLGYVFDERVATTTERGSVTFATGPEATAGTLFSKAINPVTLNLVVDAALIRMDERIDAALKRHGLIPE